MKFKGTDKFSAFSLLVGSSSPNYKSVPIMCWCSGYGGKAALAEWIRPSEWIRAHAPKPAEGRDGAAAGGRGGK